MAEIPVSSLTEATLEGSGVFDVLMRAAKQHLEAEFNKQRIRGPEYSQVYLGSLTEVLQASMAFLMRQQQVALEAQLLEQQILQAQKQTELIEAQIYQTDQQTALAQKQVEQIEKQTSLLDKQMNLILAQTLQVSKQTDLIAEQILNTALERDTMIKQQCKLAAEFDVLMMNKTKIGTETSLLEQKLATERAQTASIGVDQDSVIGRQKALYLAQTDGLIRKSEESVAKMLVETWAVRRTTDEGTAANSTNMLDDATIGRAINKILTGINA